MPNKPAVRIATAIAVLILLAANGVLVVRAFRDRGFGRLRVGFFEVPVVNLVLLSLLIGLTLVVKKLADGASAFWYVYLCVVGTVVCMLASFFLISSFG